MTTFMPFSQTDVLSAVNWALSENAPLEVFGHGSRRGQEPSYGALKTVSPVLVRRSMSKCTLCTRRRQMRQKPRNGVIFPSE